MLRHYFSHLRHRVGGINGERGDELLRQASSISQHLKTLLSHKRGERIAFLASKDSSCISALWSIWLSGSIAVPLSPLSPNHDYILGDSKSSLILISRHHHHSIHDFKNNLPTVILESALSSKEKNHESPCLNSENEKALIMYTSGTTGYPKGVVITHENLMSQIDGMVQTWKWSSKDRILNPLPLHHVHGLVNALLVPLSIGADVDLIEKFDPSLVWSKLLDTNNSISVFMAVPTMYSKLIDWAHSHFETQTIKKNKGILKEKIRLMVSGSASLPISVLKDWESLTGHVLLERYGMTEIGMALSNSLERRIPGSVGTPLPNTECRIMENQKLLAYSSSKEFTFVSESPGNLQVRGKNVFKEYFCRTSENEASFVDKNWFVTGDTASMNEQGIFTLLGRSSVDIIKRGGYKLSALELERIFCCHPQIQEIYFLGIPDSIQGQRLGAVFVTKNNVTLTLEELRTWGKNHVSSYKLPTIIHQMSSIPKNQLGKIYG